MATKAVCIALALAAVSVRSMHSGSSPGPGSCSEQWVPMIDTPNPPPPPTEFEIIYDGAAGSPGSGSAGGSGGSSYSDDNNFHLGSLPFSFMFDGREYRDDIYIGTNSYFTFGSGSDSYGPIGDTPDHPYPTLYLGGGDTVALEIRKASTFVTAVPAVMVMFRGRQFSERDSPGVTIEWSVWFVADNSIIIAVNRDSRSDGSLRLACSNYEWSTAEGTWGAGTLATIPSVIATDPGCCIDSESPPSFSSAPDSESPPSFSSAPEPSWWPVSGSGSGSMSGSMGPRPPTEPIYCDHLFTGPEGHIVPHMDWQRAQSCRFIVDPSWSYPDGRAHHRQCPNMGPRQMPRKLQNNRQKMEAKAVQVREALAGIREKDQMALRSKELDKRAAKMISLSRKYAGKGKKQDPKPRVVGSVEFGESLPFMVSFHMYNEQYCTGTLIHPRFVLTTIDCLPPGADTSGIRVLVGDHYTLGEDGWPEEPCIEEFRIVSASSHPMLRWDRFLEYNAVVVELSGESGFPPVPLYTGGDIDRDCQPNLHAAGWMSWEGRLMVATTAPMTTYESCETETTMCGSGTDMFTATCAMDMGGPLLMRDEKSPVGFVQVGITSWPMCGSGADYFTKVSSIASMAYALPGLGTTAPHNEMQVTLEVNLRPGMHLAVYNGDALVKHDPMAPYDRRFLVQEFFGEPDMPEEMEMCGHGAPVKIMVGEGPFVIEFSPGGGPPPPPMSSGGSGSYSWGPAYSYSWEYSYSWGPSYSWGYSSEGTFSSWGPPRPPRRHLLEDHGPGDDHPSDGPPMSPPGPPLFDITYHRAPCEGMTCEMEIANCAIDPMSLTVKKMVRMKKVGALFRGGLGEPNRMMGGPMPGPDGHMPRAGHGPDEHHEEERMMPMDHAMMNAKPSDMWTCMRDWDEKSQHACGAARRELMCYVLSADGRETHFYYGGPNSRRMLVSKEAYMHGVQMEEEMYGLKGMPGGSYPPPR